MTMNKKSTLGKGGPTQEQREALARQAMAGPGKSQSQPAAARSLANASSVRELASCEGQGTPPILAA